MRKRARHAGCAVPAHDRLLAHTLGGAVLTRTSHRVDANEHARFRPFVHEQRDGDLDVDIVTPRAERWEDGWEGEVEVDERDDVEEVVDVPRMTSLYGTGGSAENSPYGRLRGTSALLPAHTYTISRKCTDASYT